MNPLKNIYSVHLGFCSIEGHDINPPIGCKEEFLVENGICSKVGLSIAGKVNKRLTLLSKFCSNMNLPMPRVTFFDDYCAFTVPKKWQQNIVTFGLFLELIRASVRNDKTLPYFLNKVSKAKIKALWSKNFNEVLAYHSEAYYSNCVYFLADFSAEFFCEDYLELNKDNLPLINWLFKFEDL